MSVRRGVNRFLVVVIVIWELVWLLLLIAMFRESGSYLLAIPIIGGPVLAIMLVRAMLWIIEGFRGSPLK